MLSFKLSNQKRAVEIDCDDAGIELLVSTLLALKGSGSHVHLRAEEAGGGKVAPLSSVTPYGESAVLEVIISHGGD